jgi:protein-tyrosine phosphatase
MTRHRVLDDQPHAGVLIHCSAGRRRSAMLAYAVLHLRGHDRTRAVALVLRYRPQAQLVPAYVHSVEANVAWHRTSMCSGPARRRLR